MIDKGLKILFSERNPQQRAALEHFFKDKKIELHFSLCDGRQVLQDIEKICPHIAVLDIFMPYYDAVAVKSICEGKPHCPKMFVAQGSVDSEKIIAKIMDAGFDRYLLRPYAFEVLLDMAEKAFDMDLKGKKPYSLLECRAEEYLRELAIPSHVLGCKYLRQSIAMVTEEPYLLDRITKDLYPRLASLNGVTAGSVERSIRNAIGIMWDRGRLDAVSRYFCCGIRNVWGKPSNSEFIAIISDCLRAQLIKEKAELPQNRQQA